MTDTAQRQPEPLRPSPPEDRTDARPRLEAVSGPAQARRAEPAEPQTRAAEPQAQPPLQVTRHRRGRLTRALMRFVLMLVLPLAACIYGAIWWGQSARYIVTENAYVKSNILAIAPEIDGKVASVAATENAAMRRGDVLFRIDARPFEIAVDAARQQLRGARTEIEAKRAEYRGGLEETRMAEERGRYMSREMLRQQTLIERGASTQAKLDERQHEAEMASRSIRMMSERNRKTLVELGGTLDLPSDQHPKVMKAQADLDKALLDLERTTIRAPADGIASNVRLQAGEYVEAAKPAMTMVETGSTWIEANLKETQLTFLKVAQKAELVSDAYPDFRFKARVESLSPATGAEFALLPPQNASGNWVKVVQRVPVRLYVEPQPDMPSLRSGMTVTVTIDSERDRSLRILVREFVALLGIAGFVPDAFINLFPAS